VVGSLHECDYHVHHIFDLNIKTLYKYIEFQNVNEYLTVERWMIHFSKIPIGGRLPPARACVMLMRSTAWDRYGGRAATCAACKYIILGMIAVVITIIVVVKKGRLKPIRTGR
jgi:hypothetical protein